MFARREGDCRDPRVGGTGAHQRRCRPIPAIEGARDADLMRAWRHQHEAHGHNRRGKSRRRCRRSAEEEYECSGYGYSGREPPESPAPALEGRHDAPRHSRHRDRRAIDTRQEAERFFALGAQLRRQVGKRQLAIQQLLYSRIKLVLRHAWSRNCSRSLSYARCIRILSEGTDVFKRSAISMYDSPSTCFNTNTSRCSAVSSMSAFCRARRRSAVSVPTSERSLVGTATAASSETCDRYFRCSAKQRLRKMRKNQPRNLFGSWH